jgi:hypothetical protein
MGGQVITALKTFTPEKFDQLEAEMLAHPQAECGVRHMFTPGQYIREVTIPADTYVISHKHKHPHLNVFLKGSGTMIMCSGIHKELQAPMVFVGQPGRKVGYTREEVVWLNVFQTDETDIDKLEAMLFDKSEHFVAAQQLQIEAKAPDQVSLDQLDYVKALEDLGATQQQGVALSEENSDLISFPSGTYKVKVGHSKRQGRGLIATANIAPAETICPTRIGDKRTPAARYVNHSANPNARIVIVKDTIYLVALRLIKGCAGGFDGDEITVDYRATVALNIQETTT